MIPRIIVIAVAASEDTALISVVESLKSILIIPFILNIFKYKKSTKPNVQSSSLVLQMRDQGFEPWTP